MANTVENKRKKDCCGCNACAEICPKHCIGMKEDKKGFFYPSVNPDLCVGCGLCVNVCPFEKEHNEYNYPITAYAAWNTDRNTYLRSSSGGAAFVFSKFILENNGVVYGCSSNGLDISHIRIDKIDELYKLQGSKYVQSNVRGIFSQVKRDIKSGCQVLFIGTPCQVAGLKNYIKKVPENLFLIDIICHGVPSQKMLKEHVNAIFKGKKIERISFRDGADYILRIFSKDGDIYEKKYWKDLYYKAFVDSIISSLNCYNCPFACEKRISDITIGDFWGLRNAEDLAINQKEGISVILPCTDKGRKLLAKVKKDLFLEERKVEEAIEGNAQLRHPTNNRRNILFNFFYSFLPFDLSVILSVIDKKAISLFRIISNKFCNGFGK